MKMDLWIKAMKEVGEIKGKYDLTHTEMVFLCEQVRDASVEYMKEQYNKERKIINK